MSKLLNFMGMTVGGYLGWYLGEPVSFFAAFLLSMVGTGLGLAVAQWALRRWF